MKAYRANGNGSDEIEIPDEYIEAAAAAHEKMVEAAVEADDDCMMRYLEGEEISDEEIMKCLIKGIRQAIIYPMLCGSAYKNIGLGRLMNAIIDFTYPAILNDYNDMEKESLIKRYLVFIAGLYFLAMGISLIVHSSLGTTHISSMNYVLSINTSLSLGTWTFIVNLLMIIIQLWLASGKYGTRKDTIEILLQIPFSFIFSAFIDLNMILIRNLVPSNYVMAVGILLAVCIIQSIGVVLEIKPKAAMMSAEGLVKYIARR